MFSTTLKRSVATLGVVAGLLAAAGPASAQMVDGPVMAKAGPQPHPFTVDPQDGATRGTTAETGFMDYTDDALGFSADAYVNEMGVTAAGDDRGQNARTNPSFTLDVATSEVFELNTFRGALGYEGVKAPTNAEGYIVNDWDYGGAATAVAAVGVRENGSQGAKAPSTSARPQGVIWDLLEQANAGTQVGSEGVKAPASPTSEVFTSVSNVALLGGIVPGGAIISA